MNRFRALCGQIVDCIIDLNQSQPDMPGIRSQHRQTRAWKPPRAAAPLHAPDRPASLLPALGPPQGICHGAFRNGGQVSLAIERLLLHDWMC
jgi:hypothetical protein